MVRQKPNRAGRGFTLAELILVVAIMALMASVAVPRMGWATMDTVQVKTTAQEFANHLRLTRSLSITHPDRPDNKEYRVSASPEFEPSYTSYVIRDPVEDADVIGPINIPAGVTYTGERTFKFNKLGQLLASSPPSTAQFTGGGDTVVVTVSAIGRITVQ